MPVERKLEITSTILYTAKWPTKSFYSSSFETPLQNNRTGSIVKLQIPYYTCRGIWIYLQESEFLTSTLGNFEADFHFEDCFSVSTNKIICKYLSIHPCICHVHVDLEEFP